MTNSLKRKFGEYYQDARCSGNSEDHEGVGQLLTELKEPQAQKHRLPESTKSRTASLHEPWQPNGSLHESSSEWQMVDHKRKPKPKRKRAGDEKDRVKYPELTCNNNLTAPIRIADLQALTLYTLADGVAPNWIAFKHAHHTRKVVVLMVPGLEKGMFDGTVSVENSSCLEQEGNVGQNGENEGISDQRDQRNSASKGWKTVGTTRVDIAGHPTQMVQEALPPALRPLADIFDDIWPVKAPGDSRYYRLYSPIQAMLVSPLPQSKENKNIRGPKSPAEERTWKSQRTPITEFIHTIDELQEADYPLHPAIFEGDAEGALFEKERRDKTGQNTQGGWVDTCVSSWSDGIVPNTSVEKGSITAGRTVYAVDCEMVLTSDDKLSLARISIVDWNGKTMLDELVKPNLPIKNYFTQYSGMTPTILDPVKTTLPEIQSKLLELFTPHTILLGHSLESDLAAMKLTHPFIIDTSLIYPHPRGPPLRSSLKFLAQKYLRRDIQQQDSRGHNSVEDALAVLDLVKLKCEKGPAWGTSEAGGEPIFRRLARNKKKDANGGSERGVTSAMIDYGTPERGYGKEATVQIGCEKDDDVVRAISRVVNGDVDGKMVPGGGVDFVWARLRELESFQGWCNNNREYASVDKLHQGHGENASPIATNEPQSPLEQDTTTPTLHSTLTSTVTNIQRIHASLPPCTLLILYTGTADPRDVGRLQKLQQQFRKEFKVKKWDQLSVKWTDAEEQALRKAVEKAREGVGFLCVK